MSYNRLVGTIDRALNLKPDFTRYEGGAVIFCGAATNHHILSMNLATAQRLAKRLKAGVPYKYVDVCHNWTKPVLAMAHVNADYILSLDPKESAYVR
jgi:hypothetical protein